MRSSLKPVRRLFIFFVIATVTGLHRAEAAEHTQGSAPQDLETVPSCHAAKAGGPEQVVRELYMRYPPHTSIVFESETVLAKYFDAGFVEALLMSQECLKNVGAEPCLINGGIMYGMNAAQDVEIADLKVCKMDKGRQSVKVQFKYFGEPAVITYHMSDTKAGWRIWDISIPTEYDDEWSYYANVMGHYEELAAAWAKAQAPEQLEAVAKNREPLPRCERAKAGGPEDLVRSLYEQYPWKGDRTIINEPRKVLVKYFDESLTRVIIRNQAYRAKSDSKSHGMPSIIINSDMDFSGDITGFHICAMDLHAKTVKVQYRDGADPRTVMFKMTDGAAGWRISNILYIQGVLLREGGDEYDWSMLDALPVE